MNNPVTPGRSDEVVRVRVPLSIRKRGGRKLILAPVGTALTTVRPRMDNAMIKALARAFRWRRLLEPQARNRNRKGIPREAEV
jgi:hypothetical protein